MERTKAYEVEGGWQHFCVDCNAPAGVYYLQFEPPCESARCWSCQDKHIANSMQRVKKSYWD